MIIITFTSLSDIIDPARINSDQTLSFLPSEFDPFTPVEDRIEKYSFSGSSKRSTVLGEWAIAKITTPYIENNNLNFWKEFFASTRRGQPFTLDGNGIHGVEAVYRVFITDTQHPIGRFSVCSGYTSTFSVREISAVSE